ncbi:mitochondrial fission process protein 1 [Willisornis vidua]|uniref:Mitochondrial fission process protein 1 n=1 Tax=Willisornis vidua TaxID=1566151 RepID=A0ABQ9D351_9PASS|nr:mitochondrial fission process protein 1 [Willisornis vidua]
MGNKQKKLEAIMQQKIYDIVAITEMRWDDSHDWSAAMGGYRLIRRDSQGKRGEEVDLYVRESLESVELEVSNDKVECLWTRIRRKANKADILEEGCYRPARQDAEGDELLYKQLVAVSRSAALLLEGYFNQPDVCLELSTAERGSLGDFLEHIIRG